MEIQKRNVPQLRFGEFIHEWEERKIKETFSFFNGYAFSSLDSSQEGILWLKIADVGIGKMKQDSLSYLPFEFKEKHKKFILKENE